MFRSKTLFVVGAGASCEAGLPTGFKLRETIATLANFQFRDGYDQSSGDPQIFSALRQRLSERGEGADINSYRAAGVDIANAMQLALSIDNFIDAHRGDGRIELVGKLAIAKAILVAERRSRLYHSEDSRFKLDISGTWYPLFFQKITENVPKTEIDTIFDNISIITFNYDRCIEHFLLNALSNYYKVPHDVAASVVGKLKIFHPYGVVGRLPWQRDTNTLTARFGAELNETGLLASADKIRTFTEQVEEGKDLLAIRQQVSEAETIVFLGFAFAPQNMELLRPAAPTAAKKVFGTAYNVSPADIEEISGDIEELLGKKRASTRRTATTLPVDIALRSDKTCAHLFGEYWRGLR